MHCIEFSRAILHKVCLSKNIADFESLHSQSSKTIRSMGQFKFLNNPIPVSILKLFKFSEVKLWSSKAFHEMKLHLQLIKYHPAGLGNISWLRRTTNVHHILVENNFAYSEIEEAKNCEYYCSTFRVVYFSMEMFEVYRASLWVIFWHFLVCSSENLVS